MIAALLARTNVVTILSEDVDEASGATKVVVRVHEEKSWVRMFAELLKLVNGDEMFGLEVHKVFYAATFGDELDVRFAWTIIHWGDGSHLVERLTPVLTKNVAKPPPFALGKAGTRAASAGVPAQAKVSKPVQEDDPEPGEALAFKRKEEGRHTIEFVRAVLNERGEHLHDVYSVPLAHKRGPMNMKNRDPHETITLSSGRGRFKAVVQGIGDSDFAPKKASAL